MQAQQSAIEGAHGLEQFPETATVTLNTYLDDWLKDYDVTIITTPGQGYATWYQILYFMDEHKSLKKYGEKLRTIILS